MYPRNKKGKLWTVVLLTTLLLSLALLPSRLVYGQVSIGTLADCARMAFSTEEDFMAHDAAGNTIYVSDGDLLSPDGVICARNWDLVHDTFDVDEDMGLDAVDVLSVEHNLVAFSTELDSPHGNFTAGDLLATNGAVIPNEALVMSFGLYYDMGLDAVHFVVRDFDATIGFLNEVKERGRDYWLRQGALQGALRQWGMDIWFSTEGTAPQVNQPLFLDGDLLSARDGVIVIGQAALLPNTVPAGIPNRGVDFGLDAFGSRTRNVETARGRGLFSTEILYWPDEGPGFTDGDVLKVGDWIAYTNWDLIQAFKPRANELGLDALSLATVGPPPPCYAALTALGGTQAAIADLDSQGMVAFSYPTRHPFGNDIPFWGHLASCVDKFRVVYRAMGDAGDGTVILPGPWNVGDPDSWDPVTMTCVDIMPRPVPDAMNYYDAAEYAWLRQCDQIPLTSWDTYDEIGEVSIVPDGLYEVRLDYQVGATTHHGPWYRVQVDNTLPVIQDLNLVVQAGTSGGSDTCPVYSASNMPLMLQGQFYDEHFWRFRATIDGDLYPAHPYAIVNYYDVGYLDEEGTVPPGSLVDLHHVSVYDIVPDPADCCYSVEVVVWDRTIWGRFHGYRAWVSGYIGRWVDDDIYFAFMP
ncbi:MAG: hypothetical protein H8D78_19415 [Chloroflexi bacterium]|nr:hypothetical protein [Chloroflexota bacterium]